MNSRRFREGCNPDGRFVIVREDKEGPAIRDDSPILSHPVHCGTHCMLSYTVVDIPPGPVLGVENTFHFQIGIVSSGLVSRSTCQIVLIVSTRFYNTSLSITGCDT